MTRFLLILGFMALAVPASAQSDPYSDPYGEQYREDTPGVGVRVGIGVGAYVYDGPQALTGIDGLNPSLYDDAIRTRPAVTAEVNFPLGTQALRGRLLAGLLNIGADDVDGLPANANPFLTSETILGEANLMYYITPPGRSVFAPYLFSGLSGLFATGETRPGVNRSILAIPVGIGAEIALSRNLSFYGEASYRFGITKASDDVATALGAFRTGPGGPCLPGDLRTECKPCDDPTTTNPVCLPCDNPNTTDPTCPLVSPDGQNQNGGASFNSALFTGGLRFGFSPAPPAYIPPPPPPPPVYVAPPPPPVYVAPPAVCNLIELNPVYFDFGSSMISGRARMLLDENVELLIANPECCVFIDGTIDNQEMGRFGIPLGGRRAQAIYDYYLARGVTASKMQVRNRGEGTPNCDKEDPGIGCERNRRVETIPVDCERFRMMLESPYQN